MSKIGFNTMACVDSLYEAKDTIFSRYSVLNLKSHPYIHVFAGRNSRIRSYCGLCRCIRGMFFAYILGQFFRSDNQTGGT